VQLNVESRRNGPQLSKRHYDDDDGSLQLLLVRHCTMNIGRKKITCIIIVYTADFAALSRTMLLSAIIDALIIIRSEKLLTYQATLFINKLAKNTKWTCDRSKSRNT